MCKPLFLREIFITSTIEGFNECLGLADKIANQFDFNSDDDFVLQTVLFEALQNAYIHGNKGNRELVIRVLISVSQYEVFLEVEDGGEGYDFSTIPSPIEGSNIYKESGRGLFFIKRLCSSCCTVGKGNIIQIIIKR
jgi:serine/threonine-protein kinase RsbW